MTKAEYQLPPASTSPQAIPYAVRLRLAELEAEYETLGVEHFHLRINYNTCLRMRPMTRLLAAKKMGIGMTIREMELQFDEVEKRMEEVMREHDGVCKGKPLEVGWRAYEELDISGKTQ
ncbi:unnamed protein product [Peniophora sp. CBMAI 1063]|nr:unnamed protein product [Peniophora sp. CBMAI 1063]